MKLLFSWSNIWFEKNDNESSNNNIFYNYLNKPTFPDDTASYLSEVSFAAYGHLISIIALSPTIPSKLFLKTSIK